ncbi:MAG: hypothetical protein ACP5GJ_00680, partial [Nanopusillaceae archaeon]
MKNQLGKFVNFLYYLAIFIIILSGVFFILSSIFKFHYNMYNFVQSSPSTLNQNTNSNNNTQNYNYINSTIIVFIYYQLGNSIFFYNNLPGNIQYIINNTYYGTSGNSQISEPSPQQIINNTQNIYYVQSIANINVQLESSINLTNNSYIGNQVSDENGDVCSVEGSQEEPYSPGDTIFFCILCNINNNNVGYYYISSPEQINITPAISLLNGFPNTQRYNYTVTIYLINETVGTVTLSVPGSYTMDNFQTVLFRIDYPFNQYVNPDGSNVIFFVQNPYNGKYYALPSWYAGEINGSYYFFVNLLNFSEIYESSLGNIGCSYLPVFIGFTDQSLYSILNGTVGGDPYAINPFDPGSVVMYDNGPNVFPIYVNLYPYSNSNGNIVNDFVDGYYNSSSSTYILYYDNLWQNLGILSTYNPWIIYYPNPPFTGDQWISSNGQMEGLEMVNGENQGNYILINSTLLNYFLETINSQNGNGLNIFTYFSGIPWYDSNAHVKPLVSAAVTLSYVAGNPGTDNAGDILNVGGNTCLPLDYPIVMFEYGWADCLSGPGPGCSSGY